MRFSTWALYTNVATSLLTSMYLLHKIVSFDTLVTRIYLSVFAGTLYMYSLQVHIYHINVTNISESRPPGVIFYNRVLYSVIYNKICDCHCIAYKVCMHPHPRKLYTCHCLKKIYIHTKKARMLPFHKIHKIGHPY